MSGSKNRNLLFIIMVLLLTNVAVLGYFLWYKKPPKEAHSRGDKNFVGDMLKKEVGFDTVQLAGYKEMREKQQQVLRPMFDDMRQAKDSLFSMIGKAEVNDSLVLNLAAHVGDKQEALDLQTFRYFSELRKLCTPAQEPMYDSLMTQIFRKMGKPRGKE